MMKKLTTICLIGISISILGCQQSQPSAEIDSEEKVKTIKLQAQARPGGESFEFDMPIDKGLDKLEISNPSTVEIDSNELVLGISIGDHHLALPLTYMSGFEVANLFIDSTNYLLTWCPLVGTARIFEGDIDGDQLGFDFGRGLVDNNLLIVDRKTNTVWNQLSCKGIEGELEGERLTPLPSIQSTWAFWKNRNPDTQLLINRDTSGAVFPSLVLQKQYYNTWEPGTEYPEDNGIHHIQNLGLGIELESTSVFFPFEKLFQEASPLAYTSNGQALTVHFDKSGLTAWAENGNGDIISGSVVYDWAWKNFFPSSEIY